MKPARRAPGTTRKLFALSLSIALAMSGIGIILPVVPSHIGRMGLANASTEPVALHVSLLAAGYALMYLLFAPLWGRLSDSLGRRALLVIGLTGFAIGQALCGLATSLAAVYAIRLGTGIVAAAITSAAFAFVADTTNEEHRTRGMAQLSAAGGISSLSDRIGRKWLIAAGLWVQALGILLIPPSSSFAGFLAAAVLLGLGTAMVYPTLLAAIGDVAFPSWRASAVGVYRLWRDLGYAAGALIAGVTADAFGLGPAISAVGAVTLLSGVVIAVRMGETLASVRGAGLQTDTAGAIR